MQSGEFPDLPVGMQSADELDAAEDAEFQSLNASDVESEEEGAAPGSSDTPAAAAATAEAPAAPKRPALRLAARPKVAPRPQTDQERQDAAMTDALRTQSWRRPSQQPANVRPLSLSDVCMACLPCLLAG